MERLTYKTKEDVRAYCPPTVECNGMCQDCEHIDKMMNKLADYEDAEEQGLLIRLPCKVGTEVYWICGKQIEKVIVYSFDIRRHGTIFLADYADVPFGILGDNAFLTREEAEAKLADMQKEI